MNTQAFVSRLLSIPLPHREIQRRRKAIVLTSRSLQLTDSIRFARPFARGDIPATTPLRPIVFEYAVVVLHRDCDIVPECWRKFIVGTRRRRDGGPVVLFRRVVLCPDRSSCLVSGIRHVCDVCDGVQNSECDWIDRVYAECLE